MTHLLWDTCALSVAENTHTHARRYTHTHTHKQMHVLTGFNNKTSLIQCSKRCVCVCVCTCARVCVCVYIQSKGHSLPAVVTFWFPTLMQLFATCSFTEFAVSFLSLSVRRDYYFDNSCFRVGVRIEFRTRADICSLFSCRFFLLKSHCRMKRLWKQLMHLWFRTQ